MSMHGFGARLLRTNTEHLLDKFKWVPAENGAVPPHAVEVGNYHGQISNPMFVGRIVVAETGSIIPGTVIRSKHACFAAYDKREVAFSQYEVLVNTQPHVVSASWMLPSMDYSMPKNAIKGGVHVSKNRGGGNPEVLYIARAAPPQSADPNVVTGTFVCKLRDGDISALMAFDGSQYVIKEDFRILCAAESSK